MALPSALQLYCLGLSSKLSVEEALLLTLCSSNSFTQSSLGILNFTRGLGVEITKKNYNAGGMHNCTLKVAFPLSCATEKHERIVPYTGVLCGHSSS